MFSTRVGEDGTIFLSGRLDASQVDEADSVFESVNGPAVVDMSTLDYISSAGISVLLRAHKRLSEQGQTLKFTNLSRRVRTVFQYAGLDTVLWVE